MEQFEYSLLGNRIYFRCYEWVFVMCILRLLNYFRRGNRKALLGHCYQRPPWSHRDETRKGQQGRRGVEYNVYRRTISAISQSALEVPKDRRQQAF